MTGAARIGTSGWHYVHWIGGFYPARTPKRALLAYYTQHFSTAEINASFYHTPAEKTVAAWREQTPDDFFFAWKASRYITHRKRLLDVGESVAFIFGRMAALGEKFGPVLWQLPPGLTPDHDRLARFLALLPTDRLHTVEFRHPGWYEAGVFRLLADHNVALCISDHAAAPAPFEATAGHVYVRGHGPGGRYFGNYSDEILGEWAARIRAWQAEGRPVFCYFDNDIGGAAPIDAKRLMELLNPMGPE